MDLGLIQPKLPGACRVIESLGENTCIREFNLGIIDSEGLIYLGRFLCRLQALCYITIEENSEQPWTKEAKDRFIEDLETARTSRLLSINIKSGRLDDLEEFIATISLIMEKRRYLHIMSVETEQASLALEANTEEVRAMDTKEVVNSFSVKRYIDNVFKNKLEESLLFIQNNQANILRNNQKIELGDQEGD